MNKLFKSRFLKNAAVISFGSVAAKAIGAFYRIPLAGLLGSYGTGLYQMAYPLFCLVLTLSSSGVSAALSRMVAGERAKGRDSRETLKTALKLFFILGLCGTLFLTAIAPAMGALQGDKGLTGCYYALAPSVVLVALIGVFRGYFQGKNDMRPTAFSEICEQTAKALFGVYFAMRFRDNVALAVQGALFSVTLSECAALCYLIVQSRKKREKRLLPAPKSAAFCIFAGCLPVMVSSAVLPLSNTLDSVLLVRMIASRSSRAVALYGLLSGSALSLVGLPSALCSGLAVSAVPAISKDVASGDEERAKRRALSALFVTLLLSAPCALGLFLFAPLAVSLLYGSLSPSDGELLVNLIRLTSVSAVTLSGVQTLSSCLTGQGRAKHAALSMGAAVVIKLVLQFLLVERGGLSVLGAAIAWNGCFLVAFFLDLFYTIKKKRRGKHDNADWFGGGKARRHAARARGDAEGGQSARENVASSLGGRVKRRGDCV